MNAHPTRKDKCTFLNERGDTLAGLLEQPLAGARIFALFAHCFTCPKDILAAAHISRVLAGRGFGVLRFDFTGLGQSTGNTDEITFSTHVRDVVGAANYLRENFSAPALLIGHSLGGVAVLSAAGAIPEAAAVAVIAAPVGAESIARLLEDEAPADAFDEKTREMILLARERLGNNRDFLADIPGPELRDKIRSLGKALLVLHSPRDRVVGVRHARDIFEAALHPKSFVSLDNADHLLSAREDSQYAGEMIATWGERYIKTPDTEEEGLPEEPEIGEVVVTETDGRFAQEIRMNRHRLLADEPMDYGGTDTGPSPYELLLAGLGACTSMTIRMYAKHKKLPMGRISVRLNHEKIDAGDCPECRTREGKVDRITREVHIEGELTPEQQKRVATIANRCPVHRTIHGEIDDRVSVSCG